MDNISHAVFGGSIVHAIRWKKYGNKALGYAMLASNLPDIDIALRFIPGIDPLRAWFAHRTMTHSILFALIISPILWRIISRFTKTGRAWRKDWTLISLVSILSHLFLDRCTTYGIWFLRPFSDVWFESRIISVVDLFFTIPLIGIVVWYLFAWRKKRADTKVSRMRFIGVWFAGVYLSMMALLQWNLKTAIASDMTLAWVPYKNVFAAPQLLQPFLRYGMAELPDGSYKSTYTSVFDHKPRLYENIYWYHELWESLARTNPDVAELIARSHWRYQIKQEWSTTTFSDLRFGKLIWWDRQNRWNNMFSYVIWDGIHPYQASWWFWPQSFSFVFQQHWKRVRGN